MADIQLLTYQQMLGAYITKLKARTSITDVSPGSVHLTIAEAATSQDFQTLAKLIQLMQLRNIDRVKGVDLEALAFEMGVSPQRIGSTPSTALLTISELAFTKVASNIYAGANSPTAGDTTLKIVSAAGFTPAGTIYIGRGTETSEAIDYASFTTSGSFATINLASPLTKDHLVGEEVVLSQGGDRTVDSGTKAIVPAFAGTPAISFEIQNDVTLPDGEDSIAGIPAIASSAGSSGQVGRNKISQFISSPWSTAAVANPDPSAGGRDPETDDELRQRIKDHVHALARGTERAILRAVIGITDPEENKRVVSAFLRKPTNPGDPTYLFIDDGTGYAPPFSGIGEEVIVDSAAGSEEFFQLQRWPLVKAQAASVGVEPFNLSGGEFFYAEIDGAFSQFSLASSFFRNPGVATAQEVSEALNAAFSGILEARAKDGQVFLTPVADDPDFIRVGAATTGTDANDALRFPVTKQYTLRLYKNDKLLEKSGQVAFVQSVRVTDVGLSDGETLQLRIDGIQSPTVTFNDADFVQYSSSQTVASATASDWAIVFNKKFIGVTAAARDDGTFLVSSNRGKSTQAEVTILAGSLAGKLFEAGASSTGKSSDYKLNRLLGQIELTQQLVAGDQLKAGTVNTRGFVLTGAQASFNVRNNPLPANMVFLADSTFTAISVIQSGTWTFTIPSAGTLQVTGAAGKFSNVAVDDQAHLYGCPRDGVLRVKEVATDGSYVRFYDPAPSAGSIAITGVSSFIHFFRTPGLAQLVTFPNQTAYSRDDLVTLLNSSLAGITAEVLDSGAIRIASDRFASGFGLGIPSFGGTASNLSIQAGNYLSNDPHVASVESADLTCTPTGRLTVNVDDVVAPYDTFNADGTPFDRAASNQQIDAYVGSSERLIRTPSNRVSSSEVTLRDDLPAPIVGLGDDMRATKLSGLEFGQADNMVFLIDNDPQRKTFDIPMYVDGVVAAPSTPSTTQMDVADSSGALLGSSARWLNFKFEDYRFWLQAKHDLPSSDANAQIRFRSVPYGPVGEKTVVGVYYPSQPELDPEVTLGVDGVNEQVSVSITLGSGTERFINLQPGRTVSFQTSGSGPYQFGILFQYPVDLTAVLPGDVVGISDPAISAANNGGYRVTSVTNFVDFSKSYQHLVETGDGDVIAATGIDLAMPTSQPVKVGDKVRATGIKRTINAVTGASQGSGAVNKITVATGSVFAAAGSLLINNTITVTYTAYDSLTGEFTGLSLDPILAGVTPGAIAVQMYASPTTCLVTAVNSGDNSLFTVASPGFTSGSSQIIEVTHKALTVSSAPSFMVQVGDLVQLGPNVMSISTVYSQTLWEVTNPFSFTGISSGVVSRIQLQTTRLDAGVNEADQVSSTQSIRVFQIPTSKNVASAIIDLVNGTAGVQDVVSAENAPGSTGAGSVLLATSDELGSTADTVALQNGESYVYKTLSSSPAIQLKEALPVAPQVGDRVRLVPVTPKNIADHFSKKQISGLSIAADIELVEGSRRVQVNSKVAGGLGQVYAIGGRASGLNTLDLRGTAQELAGDKAQIELDRSSIALMIPGHTVKFSQSGTAKKRWTSGDPSDVTTIQIQLESGNLAQIVSSTPFVTVYAYTQSGTPSWTVRRIGRSRTRFEILSGTAHIPSLLKADDWVLIGDGSLYAGITTTADFVRSNQGWAQIVETDNSTYFDVELEGTEEVVATLATSFIFTPYHSARPGDQLVIGNDAPVVTENKGTFVISSVPTATTLIYPNAAKVAEGPTALGSAGVLGIAVLDQGYTTYRKVELLAPKPDDPANRSILVVSPGYNMSLLSEGQNAKISLPNRLGFGTDPVPGVSGYSYWTGLKRRAQRVVDGYEPDPVSFEGTAAAGVGIEVKEPQVTRISIGVKIKTAKGVSLQSISDTIKNAISGYVQSLDLGSDVIISEIVRQVQEVPGVESLVVTDPAPGTTEASTGRITIGDNAVARISSSDITLS